jgi:hypothetical protein
MKFDQNPESQSSKISGGGAMWTIRFKAKEERRGLSIRRERHFGYQELERRPPFITGMLKPRQSSDHQGYRSSIYFREIKLEPSDRFGEIIREPSDHFGDAIPGFFTTALAQCSEIPEAIHLNARLIHGRRIKKCKDQI